MITEEKCYTARCDGCDEPLTLDGDITGHYPKVVDVIEQATSTEWEVELDESGKVKKLTCYLCLPLIPVPA